MRKQKTKIVFINQSSGYLMIDIVNVFRDRFSHRVLIAGLINPRNQPLDEDVKIEKIIKYDRRSTFRRLLTWSWGFLQTLYFLNWKYKNAHLFIVSNPPFAPLIPLFCRNPFSLLIYDIFPDALSEFGFFSNRSWIIKFWKKANKSVYPKARHIFTLTEGMKATLSKYAPKEKIFVVPLWTNNTFLKPISSKDNPFVIQHNLIDKFVILYSGNIGLSNDVEVLIELAAQVKREDIFFLIIGDGSRKDFIAKKIEDQNLKNCLLLPWQPSEVLPYSLASGDLAVVSLGKGASKLAIPSKLFNYMSVGVPILSLAPDDSDLASLVNRTDIGRSFTSDATTSILQYIYHLADNKDIHQQLGENALRESLKHTEQNATLFLK